MPYQMMTQACLMLQDFVSVCNTHKWVQNVLNKSIMHMHAVQYRLLQLHVQFSLWLQEHVRQIGGYLLQIGDAAASNMQDAVVAMQALTVEAFKLIQCMLHNPVTNQVLIASRLDDGSPAVNSLDDDFYSDLLVIP